MPKPSGGMLSRRPASQSRRIFQTQRTNLTEIPVQVSGRAAVVSSVGIFNSYWSILTRNHNTEGAWPLRWPFFPFQLAIVFVLGKMEGEGGVSTYTQFHVSNS